MPYHSCEIRWFTAEPGPLSTTFEKLPGAGRREPARTDWYLNGKTLQTNVKVREGRHEIKIMTAPSEQHPKGRIEHWAKWSHEASPGLEQLLPGKDGNEWLAIEKERRIKTFTRLPSGELQLQEGEETQEGCDAEYSRIYLPSQGREYHTFCFEAFSATGQQRAHLYQALEQFSEQLCFLPEISSFGYPQFMLSLAINGPGSAP